MQDFDNTSCSNVEYKDYEKACPYFNSCYLQVRNGGFMY